MANVCVFSNHMGVLYLSTCKDKPRLKHRLSETASAEICAGMSLLFFWGGG